MPRVIEVIQADERIGKGTEDDPARLMVRYYTLSGIFLAEFDTYKDGLITRKEVL